MRVDVWIDIGCPWCYIGKRRLEVALAAFGHADQVAVRWRSYQLDPDIPEGQVFRSTERVAQQTGRSEDEMAAAQERIARVAAGEGLHYRLGENMVGNTSRAHELVQLAADRGLQEQVVERLLHGHFAEHRSVHAVDSLVELAADGGLDPDEARAALTDRRYRAAVVEDIAVAQRLGVTSVPFFLVDRTYAVAGGQSAEALEQLLSTAWDEQVKSRTAAGD
ncbi:DsbA family oxidoreductase [Blastococcus sp. SYSU D00820]